MEGLFERPDLEPKSRVFLSKDRFVLIYHQDSPYYTVMVSNAGYDGLISVGNTPMGFKEKPGWDFPGFTRRESF